MASLSSYFTDWSDDYGLGNGYLVNGKDYYSQLAEMRYNSAEAEKERAWQEEMRSTAYQVAAEDMKKAGLNPYLTYSGGGSPAPTPSGATANVSLKPGKNILDYVIPILTTVLGQTLSANAKLTSTLMNNGTSLKVANLNNEARLRSAKMFSDSSLQVASMNWSREKMRQQRVRKYYR